MAVVLVIGATLLGAGLKVLSAQLENSNYTNAKNKQELIKDALVTYLGTHSYLPCPDVVNATDGTPFDGREDRSTVNNPASACSKSYGVIPYQDLQLTREIALDGWGNYFSYQLSTSSATNADWSLKANFKVGNIGNIPFTTRQSSLDTAPVLQPNPAVVVLISHGKNGAGAYTVKGTKYDDPPSSNLDEIANASEIKAGNPTAFIRGYSDDSNGSGAFDDVVLTISPNDFITPLTKQGVFKLPSAQLAEQIITIQNAIIGSIVANGCVTPTELSAPSFLVPPALGLSSSETTDPWGVPIQYKQISADVKFSSPSTGVAFTLISKGSGIDLQYDKQNSVIKGILTQSIIPYSTLCP